MFESLLEELIGGAEGIQARGEGIAFLKVAQSVYPLTTTSYLGLNIPLGAERKTAAFDALHQIGDLQGAQAIADEGDPNGGLGIGLHLPRFRQARWGKRSTNPPHSPEGLGGEQPG